MSDERLTTRETLRPDDLWLSWLGASLLFGTLMLAVILTPILLLGQFGPWVAKWLYGP